MRISINLASRPFRNMALFYFIFTMAVLVVVGLSYYNWLNYVHYVDSSRDIKEQILLKEAALRRQGHALSYYERAIEPRKVEELRSYTDFINRIISWRKLSWTELFNHFENIMPPRIMMVSINPTVEGGRIKINLRLIGDGYQNILKFIENLEQSPVFSSVYPNTEGEKEHQGIKRIDFKLQLDYFPKVKVSE
ncbi:hypothetical protein CEE39_00660 [bacterium (candidate division B38) B3_B38]|nr:MAG: hypothetical protein CEE39_00660 [bacterium (candidate division B38) B3_B38]